MMRIIITYTPIVADFVFWYHYPVLTFLYF